MYSKWSCLKLFRQILVDMQPKPIVSKTFTWRFWYLFSFYQGFLSRTLTTPWTVGEGRGDHLYSTLPFPPAHVHSDIYFSTLHVRILSHISNRTACIYQADTRWDLPPYRITIWLICDVILIFKNINILKNISVWCLLQLSVLFIHRTTWEVFAKDFPR